jgi:hypothetical protein
MLFGVMIGVLRGSEDLCKDTKFAFELRVSLYFIAFDDVLSRFIAFYRQLFFLSSHLWSMSMADCKSDAGMQYEETYKFKTLSLPSDYSGIFHDYFSGRERGVIYSGALFLHHAFSRKKTIPRVRLMNIGYV